MVLACALAAGCGGNGLPSQPIAASSQIVGVAGNHMTLNGAPWISHGVTLQGFVRPSAALEAAGDRTKIAAYANYGSAELSAITGFGADTIRFQLGQPGLDPTNASAYDAGYLAEITAAVKLARQDDFVVLLTMQDEMPISGETTFHPLATAVTLANWDRLNAVFGKDRGVLYELYNEPHPPATAANWTLWANGDPTGTNATAPGAVGMQTMVTNLRAAGSQNVFVLDGLGGAKTLSGLPSIDDPLNELVYAVHPYPAGSPDESQWDPTFGVASRTLPVWVDEWSAGTGQMIGQDNPPLTPIPNYQNAVDFLNYLQARSIPLCGGAFDIPNFMVTKIPGWPYTNYDAYDATMVGDNAGQLIHVLFETNDARALTLADGL